MATVTDACVDYEGSMTISKDLMDQAVNGSLRKDPLREHGKRPAL